MRIDRTNLIDRSVQRRDARIFVVATEDTHAPEQYFEGLQAGAILDRSRVKLVVLPTLDGHSAPEAVLSRLADYAGRYDFHAGLDQLWVVVDVDRWGKQLATVARECQQRRYGLAVSNPCFELWLLLHVADAPAELNDCAQCESALRAALGAYDKTKLNTARFTRSSLSAAIARAAALDSNPEDRWPQSTGSHVYRLFQELDTAGGLKGA